MEALEMSEILEIYEHHIQYIELKAIADIMKVTKQKLVQVCVGAQCIKFKILDPEHVFFNQVTIGNLGGQTNEVYEIDSDLFIDMVKGIDKRATVRLSTLLTLNEAGKRLEVGADQDPHIPTITYTNTIAPLDSSMMREQLKQIAGMKSHLAIEVFEDGVKLKSVRPNRQYHLGRFEGYKLDSLEQSSINGYETWYNPEIIWSFLKCLKDTNSLHLKLSKDKPLMVEVMNHGIWFEHLVAPIDVREAKERGAE
jgi:hypothetical protein